MPKTTFSTAATLVALVFVGGLVHAETPLEALARSKNCLACHSVEKKLVGPSFRDVASKYQSKDAAKLVAKVQQGGSGTWGPVPMPANMQLTPQEAQTLVTLILALK